MKHILLALLFTFVAVKATAGNTPPPDFKRFLEAFDCDACGCSASGGGMGFSSMLDHNFIGLRYFYQSYTSRDGIFNNSPWVDENFNTVQLWARIPLAKRVQLSAQVPYHFFDRDLSTGYQSVNGMGDVTVLGLYTAYQTKKDSATIHHTLQLGGGVKAPVGKYDAANNGSVNPSFQLGTGSWDYLAVAEYVLRYNNWGLNAMGTYIYKTENDKHYRFGNQANYAATAFYTTRAGKVMLAPQAGMAGEVYATNRQYGQDVPQTKGDILFAKAGVEAGLGKFSLGVNGMLPVSQNLTGGRVEANYRWSVNVNYSL